MKWFHTWAVPILALNFDTAQAILKKGPPLPGRNLAAPANITEDHFMQILDHSNPALGKFSQRFWWDTSYWKGPGSPVVLFNAGELDATGFTGYCTNETITGMIAQEIGAATIVIEHRYWGESSPFSELTTANMTYLTLANNIADMTYFANNVKLPFSKKTNAKDVPWIFSGGSYPGALSAYVASTAPGTFWAYHASSAPVQTISNYWQYFYPVQQGMAQNCSADINRVITYMDVVMQRGSPSAIKALKKQFGLQNLQHNDDFMAALENGPWLWQTNAPTYISGFFEFCDYVENAVNSTEPLPGANGVGLQKALIGYASWFKNVWLPNSCASTFGYFSGEYNVECYDTYNADNPIFTDIAVNNTGSRQWTWILCNEPFAFWQDGAPQNRPTLATRYSNPAYWDRQCGLYFPKGPEGQTYGIAKGKTPKDVNAWTGGWQITNTTRLTYTNGEFDPWRTGSVSSPFRPGGPFPGNAHVPVHVIPNGVHCYDLLASYGQADPGIAAVQKAEIAQLAAWVAEWPSSYF